MESFLKLDKLLLRMPNYEGRTHLLICLFKKTYKVPNLC